MLGVRCRLTLLALASLSTGAAAQDLTIGADAPALSISKWVKGDPITIARAKGKQTLVIEFWATWCGPCIAGIPHLTELQHRFAERGVRVIGVTAKDDHNTLEMVEKFVAEKGGAMDYGVAFDGDGKTNAAWMAAAGENGIPCSFVVDRDGKVAWIGHPQGGLDEALEQIVAGKHDLAKARAERVRAKRIEWAFMLGDAAALAACADEALAIDATDAQAWDLKFTAYDQVAGDQVKAKAVVAAAVEKLGANPRALAKFAAQTLFASKRAKDCAALALPALAKAAAAKDATPQVRLAHFRAVDLTGSGEDAARVARPLLASLENDAKGLASFAQWLAMTGHVRELGQIADQASELALAKNPDALEVLQSRFTIVDRVLERSDAAHDVGLKIVAGLARDGSALNSWVWDLMTADDTKGRHPRLALAAAEVLAKLPQGEQDFGLDTIALAKFEAGRIDEAIELQQKAIALALKKGTVDPEYEERLERYQKAKAESVKK